MSSLQRFVFAAILFGLVCLSAGLIDTNEDAELNDGQLQEVLEEPTRLTRTKVRWMGEYRRPWWMRRRGGGKKKTRKNNLTKRLRWKQRRRMHALGGDDFHFVDDDRFDQLDDFIPTGQLRQDDDDKMMDAQPIRIRIRLKRRGPVKRDAKKTKKKSKKKSKKQKKKALAELAEKEAMTKVLKDFLNSRRRRGRMGRKGFKKSRLIGKHSKRLHPSLSSRLIRP